MDLPSLPPSANWYISRNLRSNVDPETLKTYPWIELPKLLEGYVWLTSAPPVLNDRRFYGSSKKGEAMGWTHGRHSYSVVLVLTPEIRKQFNNDVDILVDWIPLSKIKEANQYEKLVIANDVAKKLLPYTIIHVGDPASEEPLRKLFFGNKAREIIAELEGKLVLERKKRNPEDPELPHFSYFRKSGEVRT